MHEQAGGLTGHRDEEEDVGMEPDLGGEVGPAQDLPFHAAGGGTGARHRGDLRCTAKEEGMEGERPCRGEEGAHDCRCAGQPSPPGRGFSEAPPELTRLWPRLERLLSRALSLESCAEEARLESVRLARFAD